MMKDELNATPPRQLSCYLASLTGEPDAACNGQGTDRGRQTFQGRRFKLSGSFKGQNKRLQRTGISVPVIDSLLLAQLSPRPLERGVRHLPYIPRHRSQQN
jgi:hypothetical protein